MEQTFNDGIRILGGVSPSLRWGLLWWKGFKQLCFILPAFLILLLPLTPAPISFVPVIWRLELRFSWRGPGSTRTPLHSLLIPVLIIPILPPRFPGIGGLPVLPPLPSVSMLRGGGRPFSLPLPGVCGLPFGPPICPTPLPHVGSSLLPLGGLLPSFSPSRVGWGWSPGSLLGEGLGDGGNGLLYDWLRLWLTVSGPLGILLMAPGLPLHWCLINGCVGLDGLDGLNGLDGLDGLRCDHCLNCKITNKSQRISKLLLEHSPFPSSTFASCYTIYTKPHFPFEWEGENISKCGEFHVRNKHVSKSDTAMLLRNTSHYQAWKQWKNLGEM